MSVPFFYQLRLRIITVDSALSTRIDCYLLNVRQNNFNKDSRAKTRAKENPKSEYRNPKQAQRVKSQLQNPKRACFEH